VTDPERLVYAAAFAASLSKNFLGDEPMSYGDAAQTAAVDACTAVEILRNVRPRGAAAFSAELASFRRSGS
jgi:hypothetical protein